MKRLMKKLATKETTSAVLDLRQKQSPDNVINLLNKELHPNVIDMRTKELHPNVLDLRNISKMLHYDTLEDYYKETGISV